jgi:hypothetical protein
MAPFINLVNSRQRVRMASFAKVAGRIHQHRNYAGSSMRIMAISTELIRIRLRRGDKGRVFSAL